MRHRRREERINTDNIDEHAASRSAAERAKTASSGASTCSTTTVRAQRHGSDGGGWRSAAAHGRSAAAAPTRLPEKRTGEAAGSGSPEGRPRRSPLAPRTGRLRQVARRPRGSAAAADAQLCRARRERARRRGADDSAAQLTAAIDRRRDCTRRNPRPPRHGPRDVIAVVVTRRGGGGAGWRVPNRRALARRSSGLLHGEREWARHPCAGSGRETRPGGRLVGVGQVRDMAMYSEMRRATAPRKHRLVERTRERQSACSYLPSQRRDCDRPLQGGCLGCGTI